MTEAELREYKVTCLRRSKGTVEVAWVENAVQFLYDFLHLAIGKRSLLSAIYIIVVLAIVWLASSHDVQWRGIHTCYKNRDRASVEQGRSKQTMAICMGYRTEAVL